MRMRVAWTGVLLAVLAAGAGCTQRQMVITSEPPGAEVVVNQTVTAVTPATIRFKHYGVYDIRLTREGYYPLHVREPIRAPVHQYTGPDFVSDVLVPVRTTDRHELHYQLEKIEESDDTAEILARSRQVKEEAAEVAARRRERDEDRWTFRPPFLRERERIRRQREKEEAERARLEAEGADGDASPATGDTGGTGDSGAEPEAGAAE
jgi:hypothetical protein